MAITPICSPLGDRSGGLIGDTRSYRVGNHQDSGSSPDLFDRASSGLFLLAVTLSLVLGVFLPALACASLFRLAALGGVRILVVPLVLGLNLIGTWDPPCCAAPV